MRDIFDKVVIPNKIVTISAIIFGSFFLASIAAWLGGYLGAALVLWWLS